MVNLYSSENYRDENMSYLLFKTIHLNINIATVATVKKYESYFG